MRGTESDREGGVRDVQRKAKPVWSINETIQVISMRIITREKEAEKTERQRDYCKQGDSKIEL